MTRKDFELIAGVLRACREGPAAIVLDANGFLALEIAADLMARQLATTNPNFNRLRFLAACGFKDDI